MNIDLKKCSDNEMYFVHKWQHFSNSLAQQLTIGTDCNCYKTNASFL